MRREAVQRPTAVCRSPRGWAYWRRWCGVAALLCLLGGGWGARAQDLIVHPGVSVSSISRNDARLLLTLRLTAWPDGKPVRVFVLPDDNPLHQSFAKTVLGLFPYQLRRVWDRQLFSGTGQVPETVTSEEEMVRRVAAHPGSLGYVSSRPRGADVRPLEVR